MVPGAEEVVTGPLEGHDSIIVIFGFCVFFFRVHTGTRTAAVAAHDEITCVRIHNEHNAILITGERYFGNVRVYFRLRTGENR